MKPFLHNYRHPERSEGSPESGIYPCYMEIPRFARDDVEEVGLKDFELSLMAMGEAPDKVFRG